MFTIASGAQASPGKHRLVCLTRGAGTEKLHVLGEYDPVDYQAMRAGIRASGPQTYEVATLFYGVCDDRGHMQWSESPTWKPNTFEALWDQTPWRKGP